MKQSSKIRFVRATGGFTLIELLVVIGIIMILVAILYPVFQSVRENARQAQCISHLNQIAVALKEYRQQHGAYPPPPIYDGTRYIGGIGALYPDFVSDKGLLLCPDDRQIDGIQKQARDKNYSSYNGWVDDPNTSWDFEMVDMTNPEDASTVNGPKRTYNYFGYSQEGWDGFNWTLAPYTLPPPRTLPTWLKNEGLRWRHFPALWNRSAPDNTIITHCPHHRSHYRKDTSKLDIAITIGGTAKKVNLSQMGNYESGEVSGWVRQND